MYLIWNLFVIPLCKLSIATFTPYISAINDLNLIVIFTLSALHNSSNNHLFLLTSALFSDFEKCTFIKFNILTLFLIISIKIFLCFSRSHTLFGLISFLVSGLVLDLSGLSDLNGLFLVFRFLVSGLSGLSALSGLFGLSWFTSSISFLSIWFTSSISFLSIRFIWFHIIFTKYIMFKCF